MPPTALAIKSSSTTYELFEEVLRIIKRFQIT
jgi:hypothetical protein